MNIHETVCAVIERETGEKVDSNTSLDSLPVDSLEFMELLITIGNEIGKEVPDGKIGQMQTVGDIVRELE